MVHSLPQQEWELGGGDESLKLLEGGEGPRRRTEDQLDTNRLKMVLFLARCRDPGL